MAPRPKVYQNPFHQPEKLYGLTFIVPLKMVASLEEAFGDVMFAVSSFELAELEGKAYEG